MRNASWTARLATAGLAWAALALSGCSSTVEVGPECFDDTDCFADEFCTVDGFCVQDDTYRSCADDLDCLDPFDACWEVDLPAADTFGNYCSNECFDDIDCQPANGFPGVCYAIEADPLFLCYQQCDFDEDCFLGSVCAEVVLGGGVVDFICVPNN